MCINSWTALTSISRLGKTNNKGKGKLRWSHKIEGILGRIDTAIIDHGEILLSNPDLLLLKWLALCSESLCTKSWKKVRMNRTFNVQIRWGETLRGVTKTFTANTIKRGGTLQKIAGRCGVIWSNWLRLGS